MSYGIELRERVIEFVLERNTMQEVNKIFKIHYNTIQYQNGGGATPRS
jgi:hypothetical protein